MAITSDWHIHSRSSCDSACMTVADLVRIAADKGIRDFGLTDHLHTVDNLPDIVASREEYLAASSSPRFHFGIEVSCMSQWELDEIATGKYDKPTYGLREGGPPGAPLALALTPEHIAEFGIEYVVGGAHWPMYVPVTREAMIREYHRQNMFLAAHPLVDIVAHPWWWMGHWQNPDGTYTTLPWFDDFNHIPRSVHDEFAAAARQHGTAVEINIDANLLNRGYPHRFGEQYMEYLAGLKAKGVTFSLGSDCHKAHYDVDFDRAFAMMESVGITDEELWRLPPRAASAH